MARDERPRGTLTMERSGDRPWDTDDEEAWAMTEPLFTGVGVALATLFDGAGEVDAPATADHAANLV
jgi:hypothetical protein